MLKTVQKSFHASYSVIFSSLTAGLLILLTGCGGEGRSAPEPDEISEYVSELPQEYDSGATLGDSGDTAE
jgi:hypothetical protein